MSLVKMRNITTKKTELGLIGSNEVDPTLLAYFLTAFASMMIATYSIQPHYDELSNELSWDAILKNLGKISVSADGLYIDVQDSITVKWQADTNQLIAHVDSIKETGIVAKETGLFDGLFFDFADIPVASTPTNTDKFLFDDSGLVRYITAKTAINLVNRLWDSETISTKPALRKEATQNYALRSTKLSTTNNNVRFTIGDSWECFGMISSIGTLALNNIDWTDFVDREIILETVGWFGIENNATAPDTKTKPIITGVGRDLHGIRKALLSYDAVLGSWIVKDFEKVRFSARYTHTDSGWVSSGGQGFTIPPTTGIDIEGYYNINVKVTVAERFVGPPIASAPTQSSQIMDIYDYYGGTDYVSLDKSAICGTYGGTPINFFNTSLQGSTIIQITGDTQIDRCLNLLVNLPNGDQGKVSSIRVDIDYIGYTLK